MLLSEYQENKQNPNGNENMDENQSKKLKKPLVCFQCGEKLRVDDKFCSNCGETTEDEVEAHKNTKGGLKATQKFKDRDFG